MPLGGILHFFFAWLRKSGVSCAVIHHVSFFGSVFCAGISARTRIRTHILCTLTHFTTIPFGKCCYLDLCGARIAVFLNLRDDFEISIDFFCDPCAQTSRSFMTVTVPTFCTACRHRKLHLPAHCAICLQQRKMSTSRWALQPIRGIHRIHRRQRTAHLRDSGHHISENSFQIRHCNLQKNQSVC